MTIKKHYKIGDIVWIYGISRSNANLTKGTVISTVDLTDAGYHPSITHYIVSIPTEIEPLLEIRTWETISQDNKGPSGALREIYQGIDFDGTQKKVSQIGYAVDNLIPEKVYETMDNFSMPKEVSKPKRRYYNKKKS